MKKSLLIVVLILAVCANAALAESISFSGTVAADETYEVYAPIGGTVDSVPVKAGQKVSAEDAVAVLKTTKVYASESGTITGIFGVPGDNAETISQRYGAVMYIEGDSKYTISASTENAYNSTDTKFVHVGETVYIECRSDGDHTGVGRITSIQGTDFTVEVTEGTFLLEESVDVFRSDSYKAATRVGRGTIERQNPVSVTGSGSIVSIAVQDGDTVSKGDLLMETLEGSFDGYYMTGSTIYAGVDGTISSVNAQQGGKLEKDGVVAVLYPNDSMYIEAEVEECDLAFVNVGDSVEIELTFNQDDEVTYPGTITMISSIATAAEGVGEDSSSSTTYTVYIDFEADQDVLYGMSAVISTLDVREPEEIDDVAED